MNAYYGIVALLWIGAIVWLIGNITDRMEHRK